MPTGYEVGMYKDITRAASALEDIVAVMKACESALVRIADALEGSEMESARVASIAGERAEDHR